jgi:hypothetical protein
MHPILAAVVAGVAAGSKSSAEDAIKAFEHASQCTECAEILRSNTALTAALIDARQGALAKAESDPAEQAILDKDVHELVTIAGRVAKDLPRDVQSSLSRPLAEDERREAFASYVDLSPLLLRTAYAVSDVSLTLLSLLSEHGSLAIIANARDVGALRAGPKRIPPGYMAARIASMTRLPAEDTLVIWTTLVGLVRTGTIELPYLVAETVFAATSSSWPPSGPHSQTTREQIQLTALHLPPIQPTPMVERPS